MGYRRRFVSEQMNMKRLLIYCAVLLAPVVGRATIDTWINNGYITSAPQIDATNFVNNGYLSVFTSGPFQFYNTRNFTNRNQMVGFPGFEFATVPAGPGGSGASYRANSFVNANLVPSSQNSASIYASTHLLVDATNIVNRGLLKVGNTGLIRLLGNNVDLSRSALRVESFGPQGGFLANYWGNTNTGGQINPSLNFSDTNPRSPSTRVTYRGFAGSSTISWPLQFLNSDNLVITQFIGEAAQTNSKTVQAVFVHNLNTNITVDIVGFGSLNGDDRITPVVRFGAIGTDIFGQEITNYLYLTDTFGSAPPNSTNAFIQYTDTTYGGMPGQPVYVPTNYFLSRFGSIAGGIQGDSYEGQTIFGQQTTNFSIVAFGVSLLDTVQQTSYPQTVPLLPGRVEISADRELNLNLTRIESSSYVKLESTNHFVGNTDSAYTAISTPYCDINLGSTNGQLVLANLMKPTIPRLLGSLDLCSLAWTNSEVVNAITNNVAYHVLYVDARLSDAGSVQVLNLGLRSTNVTIGDTYNVSKSLWIDADNLTLLNTGQLSLSVPGFSWKDSVPYLRTFTNHGGISFANVTSGLDFISHRRSDHAEQPLHSFVNATYLANLVGEFIWSDYIRNDGSLESYFGPVTLRGGTADLADGGGINSAAADITLSLNTLNVTNHAITAARSLSLSVTNALNAGVNLWSVGDGFNLDCKPITGDLLDATVQNIAFAYSAVLNRWAGADRGAVSAGFTNNAAVGRLTLNGGDNSVFYYSGTEAANGLYVTTLDLKGSAAILDAATNVPGLMIDPNLTIYYVQALVEGEDRSSELDFKNGGRLRRVVDASSASLLASSPAVQAKVSTYAGITFAPKSVNQKGVDLEVQPLPEEGAVLLSWDSPANAVSYVFIKSGASDASDWALLTTYVTSDQSGRLTLKDHTTDEGRIYKVAVISAP